MAFHLRRLIAVLAVAIVVPFDVFAQPEAGTAVPASADAVAVRNFLDAHGTPPASARDPRAQNLWRVMRSFYEKRGFSPAWVREGALTSRGRHLLQALAAAPREGLDSSRYAIPVLDGPPSVRVASAADGVSVLDPQDAGRLEVSMSYAFLRLAADLGQGQVDPRGTLILWVHEPRVFDPAAVLQRAASGERPDAELTALRPAHPQYALLVRALEQHRALAVAGGWGTVPGGWTVKPGRPHANVPALRRRLAASGDLAADAAAVPGKVLDARLAAALRRFESRHGLTPDGAVDAVVLGALNVPVEERLQQIELNLERWRWQAPPREREILVNVPTFELSAYAGGVQRLAMKVVSGQGESPTPIFSRDMTGVIFRPYWTVPPIILSQEVLPAALRGGGYLGGQNMEVVRNGLVVPASLHNLRAPGVVIRQRPGTANSLGLVKFVFPNPFNVYLHDTNEKGLFVRARRALSHGCVRVEKPVELARFVLEGQPEGSAQAIASALRGGSERHLAVATPIRVSVVYFTAWVDEDGTVRFPPDIYRHDASQRMLVPASAPPVTKVKVADAA
jgi:L,D-transpeptidase YcbB